MRFSLFIKFKAGNFSPQMKTQKTPKIQIKIKIAQDTASILEALAKESGLSIKAYIVFALGEFCARKRKSA